MEDTRHVGRRDNNSIRFPAVGFGMETSMVQPPGVPLVLQTQTIMEEKKEISLEIKPEIAKGTYSNLAIITHSHSEFIIDFATMLPGLPKPDIGNRIIMTPEQAKRLLNALMDNVTKYESQFGLISLGGQQQQGGTFNLGDLPQFGPGGTKS